MTVYQRFFGRLYIDSTSDSFTLTSGGTPYAATLTTGNYYLQAYSGEGASQLVEHMQAVIRALGGGAVFASATVTYSATTSRITIDPATGGSVDITWTDTALQTLLGFTGSQTGDNAYTGSQQPQYVWSPVRHASEYDTGLVRFWASMSATRAGTSKDGTAWSTPGNTTYRNTLMYNKLTEANVLTPSTGTIYEDLEQFWSDVVEAGEPMRIYVDRTADSAANTMTALVVPTEDDAPIGSLRDYIDRSIKKYNGLWNVELPLRKFV